MFEVKFSNIELKYDYQTDKTWISLCADDKIAAQNIQELFNPNKKYVAEIKEYREKRSLNANGYFWALCGQMADKLNISNDDMYIWLLRRYGVFTYMVINPQALEKAKKVFRFVEELGDIKINGKDGIQIKAFVGSSVYDTKEMARLIDGTVSECKDLGINTLSEQELSLLKQEWKPKEC